MDISVLDSSNYFRGLLLLIKKDNKITESEHILMMRIGKALGFDPGFTGNSILEILSNKYVSEEPPVFSSRILAEKFIKDGLILAACNKEIHVKEEDWFLSVAGINNIETSWYFEEKKSYLKDRYHRIHLGVEDFDVCY